MEDFNQLVDGYVVNLVNQGITDFCDLILKLPSVYPSVALQSINRLNHQKLIPSKLTKSFIDQSTKRGKYVETTYKYKFKLPVPHPLDFEWRFSDTASAYLLNKCENLTGSIDRLIMLGTPSLFRYANERRKPNYKMHFMGDHTFVTARLEEFCLANITRCNVFYEMPINIVGSHLILDPPWYDEFIYAFIWTAKQLCNVGGYLLVSLPAIGTRPGVSHEWENILKWTNELGLVLINKEDSALPYRTPFFELNALHAEGINNVPQEWRKGDLLIFRNDNNQNTKKPEFNNVNGWAEALVGNVRFKIRVDKRREYTEFTDPSLNKIIDGDILPTVSSKDERRSKAIVWTSGNRIYHCAGPGTLFKIMQALEKSNSAEDVLVDQIKRALTDKEIILVKTAVKQIMEIVNIENKEYNYYYKT
jgi:hypothetical protein